MVLTGQRACSPHNDGDGGVFNSTSYQPVFCTTPAHSQYPYGPTGEIIVSTDLNLLKRP